MEIRLGDNEFVMGDMFTVPDIIIGHCANWAKSTGKFPMPEAGGTVDAYFKRLHSRPAYIRAAAKREAA
jgi:glutathione S-transferase